MNRLGAAAIKPLIRRPIANKKVVNNENVDSKHRTFKDMIHWRKEREQKERTQRNKKLMDTLKNDINPRFQLADIRAFTLPTSNNNNNTTSWSDLGLRDDLVRGLETGLKLVKPLPSQCSGIPAVMDLKKGGLFAAPTGCGKTLVYLVSLFQQLKNNEEGSKNPKSSGTRAIILVPTHELVRQVYRTAKALSHYAKLRVETIDTIFKHHDPKAADNLDILISTPRSLLRNRTEGGPFKIKLASVNRIVVDEADTLFSSDFAVDMKQILTNIQTGSALNVLATSATITKQLQRTMKTLFPEATIHMTPGLHATLPALKQRFITIHQPGNAKMQQTLQFILEQPTSRVIIFCNKLVKAEALHKYLCENMLEKQPINSMDATNAMCVFTPETPYTSHVSSTTTPTSVSPTHTSTPSKSQSPSVLPSIFHGNLPPMQRASIIEKFSSGAIRVLVCTDLAARGLDTPWVNHVINFDFPRSLQDYLHRAGRTARAGRGGAVTSFVTGKDRALYEYVELAAKQRRILSDPLP